MQKKELLNIVLFIEIIKSIIRVDRRVQYTRNYKVVGILFKTIDRYTMSRSLTFWPGLVKNQNSYRRVDMAHDRFEIYNYRYLIYMCKYIFDLYNPLIDRVIYFMN